MLDLQGSNLSPPWCTTAAGAVTVFGVDMSLVISAVGNSSFHCVWEFIAEDFQECFTRVCCIICLKMYRNIVCLKDSFVPT
jgi:hypothetical protein